MHPSSYERMADFCRDCLESARNSPLAILDIGSADYNGSYKPLFAKPSWRYIAADLAPGPNVEVVLRDPYRWREFKSNSMDVIVSGQTFEHAEFFWATMVEIGRVLKPGGLCCIIAPAAGPEHRYPLDCWRILADGFRAVARYAGLEVLQSHTFWLEDLSYTARGEAWHESVLIARKPAHAGTIWQRAAVWLSRKLHPLPAPEALLQIFYTNDGTHHESDSLIAGFMRGNWDDVTVLLPRHAGAAPLRIDFMQAGDEVEISALRLSVRGKILFESAIDFDAVEVKGDAIRLPTAKHLRLKITGLDPQLYLPLLNHTPQDGALELQLTLLARA